MTSGSPSPPSDKRAYWSLALVGAALVYLLAFGLLNTASVEVSFVVFRTDTPLIVVMAISAILGLIIGLGAAYMLRRRRRRS